MKGIFFEEMIANYRKKTGYSKRRIAKDLNLPEGTVRKIFFLD